MRTFFGVFLLVLALAVPASAEALSPQEAAERLFRSESIDPEWFAQQGFAAPVERAVDDIRKELGALEGIEPCTDQCLAIFERGEVTFDIGLDDQGRIEMLLFDVPIGYAASLEEAVARLTDLPGDVSVFIASEGAPRIDVGGDRPLAVGSAFKLAVLKALDNLIGAGKLAWDDVVSFRDEWRSLPTGQMREWPAGAPVTLHTLAALMISESDNSASDALIDIVTRNSVETVSPRNRPFLTTREFFQLKAKDGAALRDAYLAGSFDVWMAILSDLRAAPLVRAADLETTPLPGIEWYFTTAELCSLMGEMQDLDVLQINPGIARKGDWNRVSFKGGSDFGVFNLTTGVETAEGVRHCVSATWNDDETLDEDTFMVLYAGLLHQLK
ncbi:MAG: serine hydrolase [Parvibaculaceae bacterium]